MKLTRSLVEAEAREYRDSEPLHTVEREHVEMLPGTFRSGQYGWRDAEWVVQWYFRRYLGAYPDQERRAAEEAFRRNDFETVRDVLGTVVDAEEPRERVRLLTTLEGVRVPVASAFLQFLLPEEYVVVGEREWGLLHEAGELSEPYPDPPSIDEYLTYLETCRDLTERFDVTPWTLYRGVWRLAKE